MQNNELDNKDAVGVSQSANSVENSQQDTQQNLDMAQSEPENNKNVPSTKQKLKNFFKDRLNKQYLATGIKNKWKNYIVFSAVLIVVLILDLVLKSVFDGKVQSFIDGFISIDGRAHNTGAGFSMFSNATEVLLIISILFVLLFIGFEFFTMQNNRGNLYYVSVALIIGGTLGNMIDRFNLKYVRDFIKLEFMDFPIFNIADCALTVGVILLALWMLVTDVRQPKVEKK